MVSALDSRAGSRRLVSVSTEGVDVQRGFKIDSLANDDGRSTHRLSIFPIQRIRKLAHVAGYGDVVYCRFRQ